MSIKLDDLNKIILGKKLTNYDIVKNYTKNLSEKNVWSYSKEAFKVFDDLGDFLKFDAKSITFRSNVVIVKFIEKDNMKTKAPVFIRHIKVDSNLLTLIFEYETTLFPPIDDEILNTFLIKYFK